MIENKKILIAGGAGQVARPITEHFAKANEVWVIARFSKPELREELEALGIKTWRWTLGQGDFTGLPDDFDYVVSAAASIFGVLNDFDAAVRENAEGTGLLMHHVRKAKAFLYISSLVVYADVEDNRQLRLEGDPLVCHAPYAPSYSAAKLASEAVVRTLCRIHELPTVICRLSMAYGTAGHGGVPTMLFEQMRAGAPIPLPPKGASFCSLISEKDIVGQVEPLLSKGASVPAEIVNWCDDEVTDERDMILHVAALMGVQPTFVDGPGTRGGAGDATKRKAITGPRKVSWREGIAETLRARFPDYPFKTL